MQKGLFFIALSDQLLQEPIGLNAIVAGEEIEFEHGRRKRDDKERFRTRLRGRGMEVDIGKAEQTIKRVLGDRNAVNILKV